MIPHITLVHIAKQIALVRLSFRAQPFGRPQVPNRLAFPAKHGPLVTGRQGSATPLLRAAKWNGWKIRQGDESRQALVFTAETISEPRADRRTTRRHKTGINLKYSSRVIPVVRLHGAHYRKVVHTGCQIWKKLGNLHPALAVLRETERTGGYGPRLGEERRLIGSLLLAPVHGCAVKLFQRRFGIKRIDLTDT